jgi:hypothetical protein
MGKNVLKSSPLKPVSQYSKHVIDRWSLGGQLPELRSVTLISVQNGPSWMEVMVTEHNFEN